MTKQDIINRGSIIKTIYISKIKEHQDWRNILKPVSVYAKEAKWFLDMDDVVNADIWMSQAEEHLKLMGLVK